jgi:hypothetical protein
MSEINPDSSHRARAFLFGLAAAILGGCISGFAKFLDNDKWGYYHPEFHFALSGLIAFLVVFAVKRGVDRVKVTSCILASVLTAVGIATGDTLFYGLMIAKSQQVPLTTGLLGWTVLHLVQLKFEFSPLLTAFDILIIIAAAELCGLPPILGCASWPPRCRR